MIVGHGRYESVSKQFDRSQYMTVRLPRWLVGSLADVLSSATRAAALSPTTIWYRPPIPGVRHSHGPGFGVRDRVRVRVRRTVGMADPGSQHSHFQTGSLVSYSVSIVSKLADRHIYVELFSLCKIIPDRLSVVRCAVRET